MTGQHFNILMVEDSEDDVFLMRLAFDRGKLVDTLHCVADGMAAMAYLHGEGLYSDREKHPFPHFILLDLNMPRMSGFDVLAAMHDDNGLRPMIVHVLSSSLEEDDVQRAYALGATSYMAKPPSVEELSQKMQRVHDWHCEILAPCCPQAHASVTAAL